MECSGRLDIDGYLTRSEVAKEVLQTLSREQKLFLRDKIEYGRLLGVVVGEGKVVPALGPQPPRDRSMYLRSCKAKLLPHNPHFQLYVKQVRRLLYLPENGIQPVQLDANSLPSPWQDFGVNAFVLGQVWKALHRSKAKGLPYSGPELPPCLPRWLLDYGDKPEAAEPSERWPRWLRDSSLRPPFQGGSYDAGVPLDRFAAALCSAFDLPARAFHAVRKHILTGGGELLAKDGSGLEVAIDWVEFEGAQVLDARVTGMDFSTTKEQWADIWRCYIEPRVHTLWAQSRQGEYFADKGSWPSMEEYQAVKRRRRPERQPGATFDKQLELYLLHKKLGSQKKAADEYSKRHPARDPNARVDGSAVARAVKWIEQLMQPELSWSP